MLSGCPATEDPDGTADTDEPDASTAADTDGADTDEMPEPGSGGVDGTGEVEDTDEPPEETSGSGGEESLTFEEYLDAFNDTLCQSLIACNALPGPEHCDAYELLRTETRTAFANGEFAFDGVAAANCISVRLAQEPSCASGHAEPTPEQAAAQLAIDEACAPVLTGLVRLGNPCHDIDACAGGPEVSYCAELSSYQCMPGVCTAVATPGTVGDACDLADQSGTGCNEGLYCHPADLRGSTLGTCEAQVGPGAECFGDSWCGPGSYCNVDTTFPGSCVALGVTGGPCTPTDSPFRSPCESSRDYCDPGDETCHPKLEIGAACGPTAQCVSYGHCADGTCVASAGLDEACDPSNPDACMGLLSCDLETNLCTQSEPPSCE